MDIRSPGVTLPVGAVLIGALVCSGCASRDSFVGKYWQPESEYICDAATNSTPVDLRRHLEALRKSQFASLLEAGCFPNLQDDYGESVTSRAATFQDSDFLTLVLENAGNPNVVSERKPDRPTPVFDAAWLGHATNLRLLAAAGADLDRRNVYGAPPAAIAAQILKWESVHALVELGAQHDIEDNAGRNWIIEGFRDPAIVSRENLAWMRKVASLLESRGARLPEEWYSRERM